MPRKTHTLTLKRDGNFRILTTGDSHCGTLTDRLLDIKYHMVCVCERRLDDRGFLFEQVSVDNFFKGLRRTRLSCEKLTMSCLKRLVTLIRRDNPVCVIRSIELMLSPWPYQASLTYSITP